MWALGLQRCIITTTTTVTRIIIFHLFIVRLFVVCMIISYIEWCEHKADEGCLFCAYVPGICIGLLYL